MKRFFGRVVVTACVVFTAIMVASLPFAYAFAGPSGGLDMSVGMLVAAFAAALLQGFWFSGLILKRMRYAVRLAGFALTAAPAIYLCGWFAGWFPRDIEYAVSFFAIFLVLFAVISIGYTVHFKRVAGGYQEALEAYRRRAADEKR
ncbi:hypothetical protein [Raoultibacter timonensis]|uniref:DUF3021 family protein n=1 Tax=Raoultibacter timonensis TaxID=1907662 RepID=A0ABN6MFR8_9ACTN|nr:hypothetical protein [Raoultibacter timonensis]BDE95915.1 hypothetical protein CE91St30_12480 [Raoultibacter timonensis]BDF50519.1 hypothetical protein CE91St31_12490 [Raoultibacter timonensis]